MDDSLESVFQSELMNGERVYWSGQPDPAVVFSSSDIYMIPFSLMWGGFAIFWESSVLGIVKLGNRAVHGAPDFFVLWGIPFVLIGLYMIFGRFFYKVWKKKRTYYAVTDKRVLSVVQTTNRQVQAQFLNQIPVINKSVGSNGVGNLVFGNTGYGINYGNSGMDFMGRRYGPTAMAFYDIHDAEAVYQIIERLQSQNAKS